MKKLLVLVLCAILLISAMIVPVAAYESKVFQTNGGIFCLDRAMSGGYRSLAENPFGLESIEIMYVESGSICYYGGQEGFAAPPEMTRVDYISGTENPMSNPISAYPFFLKNDGTDTVNDLFDYFGAGRGKALIFSCYENYTLKYYMLQLNGGSVNTTPTVYPQKQTIYVDGTPVELNSYALKDKNGNLTNYVRIRDIAMLINNTYSRFEVSWDGAVNILRGMAYTPVGSEFVTPFSGEQTCQIMTSVTKINNYVSQNLHTITLTDAQGGGYTYYKLRDLGNACGFEVDWTADKGISITTYGPITEENMES